MRLRLNKPLKGLWFSLSGRFLKNILGLGRFVCAAKGNLGVDVT